MGLLGKHRKLVLFMSPEDVFFLGEKLDWIYDTHLVHDEQHYPKFDSVFGELHGPATRLENASFIEYVYADEASSNYAKTQEEKYLNELVAILYRPLVPEDMINIITYDGESRAQFHAGTVKTRKALMETLPLERKQVIWKFFLGCKRHILDTFPEIFPGDEEEGSPKRKENPYATIQLEVAKNGALGDLDKVQQQNVYNVFALWRDLIQNPNA